MTNWRALTLRQPWAWAVCHAGKDVENRTWPVPPALLNRPCNQCDGAGFGAGLTRDEPLSVSDVDDVLTLCAHCEGSAVEPLRVMIHAGKQWDPAVWDMTLPWHDGTEPPRIETKWWGGDKRQRSEWTVDGWSPIDGQYYAQPFGAVVAVATITGSHEAWSGGEPDTPTELGWCCPMSEWAQYPSEGNKPMTHHWPLADVHTLAEPVHARGRQRLWTPDQTTIDAVEQQLN